MRVKKPALVITFDSTTQAMAAEKFCTEHGLPGRIIPIPREISAGCGLSWKALPDAKDALLSAMEAAGLNWSACQIIEI